MKRSLTLFWVLTAGWVIAADADESRIRKRLEAIRASDTEAWRQIPWTASLLDASRTAKKEGRLMFVFSHDGNIDTGRC